MDGNQFENGNQNNQNNTNNNGQYGNYQNGSNNPYGNYQDNTANIPYQPPYGNGPVENKANGLQIAGLVCGILAICACWCYGIISIILGIAGLICSIVGNNRNRHGIGIAGLICSIIGLILGVVSLIYFIWVIRYMMSSGEWNDIINYYNYLYN